ncbi:restriction endonuclease subunit S [Aeromonas veronii]|uniref:restriction endonuclease subunit S n=1 Tax=Aeromonas veronii TaxID=654 RepID=UPI00193275D0|nr:restriction endonuclease subunit S [Aeromonas veronii]MBM0419430.1 restriction endonuclease subunit S [Aeromonas veronii]MBW3791221.1 restriction endonuclease subunit S [Aeromonas veronii]
MVPKGWTHTTFEKHVDCLTGFAFKSDNYSNAEDDIRLLRGDNIEPGNLRWRDAKYWPKGELHNLEKYYLADGDFVIALDRTWVSSGLKVAEVTPSDLPCLLVQRVARIRAKTTLEQNLLRQYFSGHRFEQHVKSVQTATAVPHISPNDIKNFTVSLPPIPEQKKIAKILTTWDKAISTTEKLLANSQQQKKALMQQLLTGKKRLLDKNGVRFSGEWKAQRIGSLLKEVKRPVQWDDDSEYHLLSVKRRSEGVVLREILKGSDILTKKMNTALAGDFLISKMQVVHGATGLVTEEFNKYHISDSYISLRPKDDEKIDIAFFSWFSKQKIMYHKAFLCSYGVHIEKMTFNFNMFVKERVVIPVTLEEQQKIAAVLSTADKEITTLQQKLDALKQEKKALMQQLLTGKLRVKVEEVA